MDTLAFSITPSTSIEYSALNKSSSLSPGLQSI
ncbi:uncharacterized protein METZ01_LOCUS360757 [marine metagenome]|uniref:Uncharacterized protein n=1 Tax=marine metagenome TaxID=408172 RepID=A0A382SDF7_9ZZZZ